MSFSHFIHSRPSAYSGYFDLMTERKDEQLEKVDNNTFFFDEG